VERSGVEESRGNTFKVLQRDVSASLDMTGYFVRLNLPVKR
jgi:hypothetical protein